MITVPFSVLVRRPTTRRDKQVLIESGGKTLICGCLIYI